MKSLSFFKGLSWLIFLNLLVKPVWIFFIDRQVQNIVGHEAYGEYFAVLNLTFVLFFISDAGLSNLISQRMAQAGVSLPVKQLLHIKALLLVLFIISCSSIAWIAGVTQWEILLYVIVIQSLNSIFIFLRSMVTARQYFKADAWFSITDKFLMTVFCGLLIYTSFISTIDVILFLQVQTISIAIAVIIAFIFLTRKRIWLFQSSQQMPGIWRNMLPFALVILLMAVQTRLDAFLLERIHVNGAFEAGIYATAFRLLDAGNMAGYLAASFLVPFVSRNLNNKPLVSGVLNLTRHGLLVTGMAIALFCLFFAGWIQQLLYHTSDPYNSRIIMLTLLVLPALYMVHVYGSALTAAARFRLLIALMATTAFINLLLNLLLIPRYGAEGCCYAAITSQYLAALACYIFSLRSLSLAPGGKLWLSVAMIVVMLTAWFYFAKMAVNNVWIILATAILMVAIILASQIKLFKKYFISHH